jgi:hypothetical protein
MPVMMTSSVGGAVRAGFFFGCGEIRWGELFRFPDAEGFRGVMNWIVALQRRAGETRAGSDFDLYNQRPDR